MLKVELKDVKAVNGCCKKMEGRKRKVLKNTPVASTERELREAEKATNGRKKAICKRMKGKRKSTKKQVVSSEEETESSTDDSSDEEESLAPEILDCIEVVERKS